MLFFFSARSASISSSGLSSTSRITWLCMPIPFVASQTEVDGRAMIRGRLRPGPPAVAVNDPLHGSQANARSIELALLVQALERGKQFVGVSHIEARAVVSHEVRLLLAVGAPESDRGVWFTRGEFPRVAEQVLQHDAEQMDVAGGAQPRLDLPGHLPIGMGRLKILHDGIGERAQI